MKKKILLLCQLDGFANNSKPEAIKSFLEKRRFQVEIFNTFYLSRFSEKYHSRLTYLPSINPLKFLLYCAEALYFLQKHYLSKKINKFSNYYILLLLLKLRAKIIYKKIKNEQLKLLICENPFDSYALMNKFNYLTLYDCPTPWADEFYFGDQLYYYQYQKLKAIELKIFNSVDYLSFHWEIYGDYVRKYYGYGKNNIVKLNAGTERKTTIAVYNSTPKIVYIGYLGGYWINLPLLSKLSRIYPNIDVYGSPKPPGKYRLNYKGYAKPDIVDKYQFGLITITKDPLRQYGFSQKHLEYISYGLPVFIPEWRKNTANIKGSIQYNEQNFLQLIKKFSNKKDWSILQDAAIKQANDLNWNSTLLNLERIINK